MMEDHDRCAQGIVAWFVIIFLGALFWTGIAFLILWLVDR